MSPQEFQDFKEHYRKICEIIGFEIDHKNGMPVADRATIEAVIKSLSEPLREVRIDCA